MFHLAAMLGISFWYFWTAKKYNRNRFGWFFFASFMYLTIGLALLKLSELFLINESLTLYQMFEFTTSRMILSFSSIIIILFISILMREYFVKREKALW